LLKEKKRINEKDNSMSEPKQKPEFIRSFHCRSEAHCNTCRDRVGGREWRKSQSSLYVLPNNEVDFECPFGKSFIEGGTSPKASKPIGTKQANQSGVRLGSASTKKKKGCGCSRAKK
jgi:hypothetical protein